MSQLNRSVDEYDFIVVGAGSAGAVVAARLSEGKRASVLLLEAGPRDRSPWIHLPIGFSKTFRDSRINWMYESDPEPNLGGRRIYWPRGKVLGGSSSINGLIWLRGLSSDYAHWASLGNPGWGADKVLPWFDRIEAQVADVPGHQGSGPLGLSFPSWRTPLSDAFIEASREMTGVVRTDGFNAGEQLGGGYFLHTQRAGWRTSSATAYLRPASARPNLRIVTDALVGAVEFDGEQARRVRYTRMGQTCIARARREIIVCGGAINTPQLLQLSGVGPARALEDAGVAVHHALPGVGENFHDHFTTRVTVRTESRHTTLNSLANSWVGKARLGAQWAVQKRGPLTIGAGVAGAYIQSCAEAAEPDVQMILVPFKTDKLYKSLTPDSGFQILVTPSRPTSRGRLMIRSADASQPPSMFANYFDTDADRRVVTEGLRSAVELLGMPALRSFAGEELAPGKALRREADYLQYASETGSSTQHHCGSCRMGDDEAAVVDATLRVHGLQGLRIADASVIPQVVSANINAACFMIGERCADFVKEAHADCF